MAAAERLCLLHVVVVCVLSIIRPAVASGDRGTVLALTYPGLPPYAEVLEGLESEASYPVVTADTGRYRTSGSAVTMEAPAVVVAIGPDGVNFALDRYPRTPLVVTYVLDEDRYLRRMDGRPGILVSILADPEETFSMISLIIPNARKVGVIFSKDSPEDVKNRAAKAAAEQGFALIQRKASGPRSAANALSELFEESDVFWWIPSVMLFPKELEEHLLKEAYKRRIPVVGNTERVARRGALLTLIADNRALGRQLALAAEEFLESKGPKGPQLRFHDSSSVSVNRRLLEHIGLSLSEEARSRVELYTP